MTPSVTPPVTTRTGRVDFGRPTLRWRNLRIDVISVVTTAVLVLAAIMVSIFSLGAGDYDIAPWDVLRAVFGSGAPFDIVVVREWRAPRVLMALILGALLGISGAIFQSLTKNALGSPDVIGFNSGCYFGALVVILFVGAHSSALLAVGAVAGGHRNGTHSLLGVAVLTGLAWAAGSVTATTDALGDLAVGAGLMALLLVAFAARALRLTRRRLDSWVLALSLAAFVTLLAPTQWDWLPVAVGLGAAVHVAGDMLTGGGVPLLWPWEPRPPRWWRRTPVLNDVWTSGGNMALPLLGRTGSRREHLLVKPLGAYAAYGMGVAVLVGSLAALGYDADRVVDRMWDAAGVLVQRTTVVGTVSMQAQLPG